MTVKKGPEERKRYTPLLTITAEGKTTSSLFCFFYFICALDRLGDNCSEREHTYTILAGCLGSFFFSLLLTRNPPSFDGVLSYRDILLVVLAFDALFFFFSFSFTVPRFCFEAATIAGLFYFRLSQERATFITIITLHRFVISESVSFLYHLSASFACFHELLLEDGKLRFCANASGKGVCLNLHAFTSPYTRPLWPKRVVMLCRQTVTLSKIGLEKKNLL